MIKKMSYEEHKMGKTQSLATGFREKQRIAEEQKRKEIIYRPV